MKKCPFCAEEIQDEAIKCKFCNSFLFQSNSVKVKPKEPFSSGRIVKGVAIGIAILVCLSIINGLSQEEIPQIEATADHDTYGMTNELAEKSEQVLNNPEFKMWKMYNNELYKIYEESNDKFWRSGLPSAHLLIGQKLRLELPLLVFPYISERYNDYGIGYMSRTKLPLNSEVEIIERIEKGLLIFYKIKLLNGLTVSFDSLHMYEKYDTVFFDSLDISQWYDTDERKKQRCDPDKIYEWENAKVKEIEDKYFWSKGLDANSIIEKASNENWDKY